MASDPAVGVVLTLRESVAGSLAVNAQLGVHLDEIGVGVDDLGGGQVGFETSHAGRAPVAQPGAVAQLRRSLKGDERRATHDARLVAGSQVRSRDEAGAEDVGVDDDGTARLSRGDGGEEGVSLLFGEVLDRRL